VFGRNTAIAYRDRVAVVQPLMQIEMFDVFRNEAGAHGVLPEVDNEVLVSTCGRDRELHALVLSRAVEGSYAAAWDLPEPIYDAWAALRGIARPPVRRFYLYLCDDLLRSASQRESEDSARR
jgi:hypothetical protein